MLLLASITHVVPQVKWLETSVGVAPPRRCCSGMAFDSATENTVLFGGFEVGTYHGDAWIWNGTFQDWKLQMPPNSPSRTLPSATRRRSGRLTSANQLRQVTVETMGKL